MAKSTEKSTTPAYGSYKTFTTFINDVRKGGHVPMQVDRTLMPTLSGSAVNETIGTLRFLGLVTGDNAEPTSRFEEFVMASDEGRKPILESMVRDAYAFLFKAPNFDVQRASGQQVADLFRTFGINGSTLYRAISFFLAACKDCDIKVSHNVKAPKPSVGTGRPKKGKKQQEVVQVDTHASVEDEIPEGVHRFELPIPGKPSVQVLVPDSLDADDWEMLSNMFALYVNRWKGYSVRKKEPAS